MLDKCFRPRRGNGITQRSFRTRRERHPAESRPPVMNFHYEVTPSAEQKPAEPPSVAANEIVDLLRQILEVQRGQLEQLKASIAVHDHGSRWRAFLTRWQEDFPGLSGACRTALPILERSYGANRRADRTSLRERQRRDRFRIRLARVPRPLRNASGPTRHHSQPCRPTR